MLRDRNGDFDKTDLKNDLKRAGFEDCIADNIADRVDERKAHGRTYETGRQEAIREAQLIIDSSHATIDNFRGAPSERTRPRAYDERERVHEPDRESRYQDERESEYEHEPLTRKLFG